MLLTFRATNARSFQRETELSLLATSMAEKEVVRRVPWHAGGSTVAVLPVAGVFGANGSGKSNLLKVMDDMRSFVLHSFRHGDPTGGVGRHPFALSERSRIQPTSFEIDLVLDGVRHEYGFTIDDEQVLEEWAFRYPKGRAALVFRRSGAEVDVGASERAKSRAVIDLLRPNALYLSTAASANHPLLLPLYRWFSRNLLLAEAETRPRRQAYTTELMKDERHRQQILALLQAADLGIVDARRYDLDPAVQDRVRRAMAILTGVDEDSDSEDRPTFEELGMRFVHQGLDGEVEFDPDDESLGTRVWFGLLGPVVEALAQGAVLLADELDASLHPSLVVQLVRLFQDPETNPHRAQLVFNSHDPTLLGDSGDRPIGRDQIWFTEKATDGSTRLYPLVDLDPRKQEAVGKRYLEGRYGAVPILSPGEFANAAELITTGRR